MKRGEIWWVEFAASIGGEIKKRRPAVIISINISNKILNRVQIIPLTSNISRIYPPEALITFKKKPCKAMADQIQTASKKRLIKKIEKLSNNDMESIEMIIKLQLGLR